MEHDGDTVTPEDRALWGWLGLPGPSDLSLSDGESVRETWLCNHAENRRIARGGRLYLTTQRIAFRPHSFDARLGATSLDLRLGDVRAVTVEPCDSLLDGLRRPLDAFLAGGLRSRLQVTTNDRVTRFVVSDPDTVERAIEATLPADGGRTA